jgi:hypothetical protein
MRSLFKTLLLLTLAVCLPSADVCRAATSNPDTQPVSDILVELQLQARRANEKWLLQTPIVLAKVITRQIQIPPQKKQYLNLLYIHTVALSLRDRSSECLPGLAQMLQSSNSFERETVTELIMVDKNNWLLTPEFCAVLSHQIEHESDPVVHFDLFSVASQARLQSPSVLKAMIKWVKNNYKNSDYLATHGVLCMAHIIAVAPLEWSSDVNAALQTLSDLAKSSDAHVKHKVSYALEIALQCHPQSRYSERFRQILVLEK